MPVCIRILVLAALAIAPCAARSEETLLVEAEGFRDRGGWVVDQQSMDQMGSPYLLAHGLGVPWPTQRRRSNGPRVASSACSCDARLGGQLGRPRSPGKFQLIVNGKPLDAVFEPRRRVALAGRGDGQARAPARSPWR